MREWVRINLLFIASISFTSHTTHHIVHTTHHTPHTTHHTVHTTHHIVHTTHHTPPHSHIQRKSIRFNMNFWVQRRQSAVMGWWADVILVFSQKCDISVAAISTSGNNAPLESTFHGYQNIHWTFLVDLRNSSLFELLLRIMTYIAVMYYLSVCHVMPRWPPGPEALLLYTASFCQIMKWQMKKKMLKFVSYLCTVDSSFHHPKSFNTLVLFLFVLCQQYS